MTSESSKVTRRKFLRSALALSTSLVATNLISNKVHGAFPTKEEAFRKASGGDAVTLNLEKYEELKQDGGFVVIKEVLIGDTTDNLIIVRRSETEYLVLSSVCRHKKCNVKYKSERQLFVCPCHGSTYNLTGKVIKGPSTGDIPLYDAALSGTQLIVSPKQ
jgi:cytochrome b6-f complex iron-sulfur subunit